MNKEKIRYIKNLERSFVLVLLFLIILFYLFPGIPGLNYSAKFYIPPKLIIIDIPVTRQINKSRPKPQNPVIPIASDEIEYTRDVVVEIDTTLRVENSDFEALTFNSIDFPSQPRQILEVLPENLENRVNGVIKLSLLIDAQGYVKTNKVLTNTTKSDDCLEKVISAANMSRWQPFKYKGRKVEYWIEKSYIFE